LAQSHYGINDTNQLSDTHPDPAVSEAAKRTPVGGSSR
jgi:hypothetical protein